MQTDAKNIDEMQTTAKSIDETKKQEKNKPKLVNTYLCQFQIH